MIAGPELYRQFRLTIRHEPSWYMEAVSAVGVLIWGAVALLSDHFATRGWLWLMPAAVIVFGLFRAYLLRHLAPLPRVLCAMVSFVWWGWLAFVMIRSCGYYPLIAAPIALTIGDFLTVLRFSLPEAHH